REAEDIVGTLCDLLLTKSGDELTAALHKIDGIAFQEDGRLVQKPFRRMIDPDLVELPDFASIRGLTSQHPMAAGVLETSRGCTESCTYCEVIQQFVGYRRIKPEVEIKRLKQLMRMAEDGLIYRSPLDGRFPVFISDDLHSPPRRAIKFRDERLARARNWRSELMAEGVDPEKQFFFISQNRAELGSDPEMMDAFWQAGMRMLYLGVESSSAENLKLVNKRQDPDQMEKDLTALNAYGYQVVAMTIIGLPYDNEDSIMELATWVTQRHISRYQTANLLTPLPATVNWPTLANGAINLQGLQLLNREGELLNGTGIPIPGGELPPYDLFTGRQFVHYDRRWNLQESQELFQRYTARLHTIDKVYERILRSMRLRSEKTGEAIPVRV
ncbi:MAG: B12-binding domain-containing radical SAM protein, partial [Dehalococcoidia bacterium]